MCKLLWRVQNRKNVSGYKVKKGSKKMMDKFEKVIIELYGKEIIPAVEFCTEEAIDIFGEEPTLDELFIVWGSICKQAVARECEK
jgi:hypothetical protein